MRYLILLLFLVGCSIDHDIDDLEIDDPTITIDLQIEQLKELCTDVANAEEFETEVDRKAFIAQCVLDNLLTLDVDTEDIERLQEIIDQLEEEQLQ